MTGSSDAEYQYAQLVRAVNENWASKQIFQRCGLSPELSTIESMMRPHGLKAVKLCGAGKSGYLLAMFEDVPPWQLIDSDEILEFKLDQKGLTVKEL
jgi:galactokinase/mevalonate kinase-like predicted kinase